MKNILLIIDDLGAGGAERQLTELAIGLKEKGYHIYFVVFPVKKNRHYEPILKEAGIKVEYNSKGINKFRRIFEIIHLCKKHKIDCVIAYKGGVSIAAAISRVFHNSKVIVSERSTTQYLSKSEKIRFWSYKFVDAIISNSYSQQNFIINNFPHLSSKTDVITNVIDCKRFHPGDASSRSDIPVLFTTARISKEKNILNYIDALKILKDQGIGFKVLWFGAVNNNESYFKEVTSKIIDLGLSDDVSFKAPVVDIESKYREADIFVLPSLYEGFPNVICEAMATGLPVVCSDVCDNPYIVENDVNGLLFNPYSAKDIALKLKKAISVYSERKTQFLFENRHKILELCQREAFLTKYINIIES